MNLTPEPALLTTTLHCPPVLVSKMDKMQPQLPKGTEHQKQTEGRWVRVVSRTGIGSDT